MVFQDGEAEAYLSVPSHPIPPFWVAALDWHAWLLAPSLILAFLTLRPAAIASLVVSCAAAVFLYYLVAPKPSLVLLEIVRASCRERVCQYVSISVVAVSLKKK